MAKIKEKKEERISSAVMKVGKDVTQNGYVSIVGKTKVIIPKGSTEFDVTDLPDDVILLLIKAGAILK